MPSLHFYRFKVGGNTSRMCAERPEWIQPDLNNLSIEKLNELLVDRTLYLWELLNDKNADGIEFREVQLQVKNIQEIIRARMSGK